MLGRFGKRSLVRYAAFTENDDLVAERDRATVVADHDGGAAAGP